MCIYIYISLSHQSQKDTNNITMKLWFSHVYQEKRKCSMINGRYIKGNTNSMHKRKLR